MFLYIMLGIAAVTIIALIVVLSRRGAQMEGSDFPGQHTGMTHRIDRGFHGGGDGGGDGGGN